MSLRLQTWSTGAIHSLEREASPRADSAEAAPNQLGQTPALLSSLLVFKDIICPKAPLILSPVPWPPALRFQFQQKGFPWFLKDSESPEVGNWYCSRGLVQAPFSQERAHLKADWRDRNHSQSCQGSLPSFRISGFL